jgi:hypothetical protein
VGVQGIMALNILFLCFFSNLSELHLVEDIPGIQRKAMKAAHIPYHPMYTTNKKKNETHNISCTHSKDFSSDSYLSPFYL